MINAWSLAYDVLNGTLDENFPIKENKMSKDDLKIDTSGEGVVNVPSGVNLDTYEHSDAWYDYTRNDPDRENPFTDPKDRARADRVVVKAEELDIKIPSEFADSFDHLMNKPKPGIESNNPRKYKEDESIKALQDYISTTYNGHYTSEQNNVQTLDLIESVGDAEAFCRSNAIKYLSRYDKKGQAKRDILKALHYSLLLYHFSGQLNETPTRGYETF